MRIEPISLRGEHVELVPLEPSHVAALAVAATGDRTSYRFTEVPAGEAAMAAYVDKLLAQRDADTAVPFVQRRCDDGRLVGCTRFMELRWWPTSTRWPDEVEIGGTWLAGDTQRSAVNTEAKLLLLTHAFDTWGVRRVALCTDARNERSLTAIERIGARFEGVLRQHRPSAVAGEQGRLRDSALFALTADDWPSARAALRARLGAR
ncbi:MAG: GNAT family N-acetyltransferase [Actinomycetota bacterium]|nr:GNAT family N-acetyltransferase [Actinomycetota bacterium]